MILVPPHKVMGRCFRERRPIKKPRGRCKSAVLRETIDLMQTQNWKAAARYREGWKKEMEDAVTQKWPQVPKKKNYKKKKKKLGLTILSCSKALGSI
jgi:hypothetical protein